MKYSEHIASNAALTLRVSAVPAAASITSCAVIVALIDQPTTRRENFG